MAEASLAALGSSYAETWTPRAARPEGSRFLDHAASHSTAFAVLHATLGPPGTVDLAEFCSKYRVKRSQVRLRQLPLLSKYQSKLQENENV